MGELTGYTPEKLVIGVLSTRECRHEELSQELIRGFGPIDEVLGPYPFTFTTYYDEEMGAGILRYFYVMKDLISPDRLSEIKIRTNAMEELFSEEDRRKINLDPGLLSRDRFILATTKDRGHRIPLQNGIYGELTLIYMHKAFQVLPWTYTDFASETYRELLKGVRKTYLAQLRGLSLK
jgi:hypothetical protein